MLVALSLLLRLLPAIEPSSITIDERSFLSQVEGAGPEVFRAAEAVALAEADLLRVQALQAPEASWSMERPSSETRQDTFALAWTLPVASGRRHSIRAAEMAMESARQSRELATLDRRQTLRALYAIWTLGERRVGVEREHLARLEEASRQLRARVEHGEAAGLAARRISLEVEQTRRELIRAEAQQQSVRRLVSAWCPSGCVNLEPQLPDLPPAPSSSQVAPPALQAARAELGAAEARMEAASAYLAAPRLEAGWQRQEAPEAERSGPVAGIGWLLPIGGTRKADRAAARAGLESAQARLQWTETIVAREVDGALAEYIALRESALASAGVVEAAAAVADASSEAFRLGGVPLTDLLDTWRTAREIQVQSLQLHGEAAAAHRRLERLGGFP
jgi:outer membrane protein TolC